MNTTDELLSRLKHPEDGFTERKTEAAANAKEIRKTLVAFANSVPEGRTAVLYIGVENDGTVVGVNNADSLQKTIGVEAKHSCYPPVNYQADVLQIEGRDLLAVQVGASDKRPHFSGPAFVREGSQSKLASDKVYEELISSRNEKAGKILRTKNQPITFLCYEMDPYGRQRRVFTIDCQIEECDAHVVSLLATAQGKHFSVPLANTTINYDQQKQRMMLEAQAGLWTSSFM